MATRTRNKYRKNHYTVPESLTQPRSRHIFSRSRKPSNFVTFPCSQFEERFAKTAEKAALQKKIGASSPKEKFKKSPQRAKIKTSLLKITGSVRLMRLPSQQIFPDSRKNLSILGWSRRWYELKKINDPKNYSNAPTETTFVPADSELHQ